MVDGVEKGEGEGEVTLSHTTMRFQNPIMLNSNGVSPIHAPRRLSSLIATTYIVCSTNSIVRRHETHRTP